MALTYSPTIDIGSKLPEFEATDVFDKPWSTKTRAPGQLLVVMFICNHCPYVQAIETRLLRLAKTFSDRGVEFIGVCSNDSTDHPEDSPANLKKRALELDYPFRYLIDEDQSIAKSLSAVCTPDLFVYDKIDVLKYRGRLDDSWRDESKVKSQDLSLALSALLAGENVRSPQHPSMGCSIKWKS